MDRPLRIGELARQTGLSVRALRHDDARGLVRPQGRSAAGHRLYAASDVARLQRVVSLRALGLGLAAIAEALPLIVAFTGGDAGLQAALGKAHA